MDTIAWENLTKTELVIFFLAASTLGSVYFSFASSPSISSPSAGFSSMASFFDFLGTIFFFVHRERHILKFKDLANVLNFEGLSIFLFHALEQFSHYELTQNRFSRIRWLQILNRLLNLQILHVFWFWSGAYSPFALPLEKWEVGFSFYDELAYSSNLIRTRHEPKQFCDGLSENVSLLLARLHSLNEVFGRLSNLVNRFPVLNPEIDELLLELSIFSTWLIKPKKLEEFTFGIYDFSWIISFNQIIYIAINPFKVESHFWLDWLHIHAQLFHRPHRPQFKDVCQSHFPC